MEGLNIEYKREYTDNIKKTVIAFANTEGGKIYIGIEDDGEIIGVKDADDTMLQITNSIRSSILPDVTLFTVCKTKVIKDKYVVELTIQKGSSCPYYLKSKGIRPEGVYVRQGASSVPASETNILNMIKDNMREHYEDIRSLEQELTFETLETEFKKANLKWDESKEKTLGIIGRDDLYTNLALMLSEQCVHSIKLAIFEGNNKTIFKDRYEFKGSLLKQLDEVYSTINRYNRTKSHIDGLRRQDTREYPLSAIREVLLNMIVHRDYSYNASALISIYDDRIEFLSVGGLVQGIGYDEIMAGVSISRNPNLSEIFYRLQYIEAYGTGIGKIMDSYNEYKFSPSINITDNSFKVTLPSILNQNKVHDNSSSELINKATINKTNTIRENYINTYLTNNEILTLDLFATNKILRRKDIQFSLGISQPMAVKILKKLLDKGLITKHGSGKNIYYTHIDLEDRGRE